MELSVYGIDKRTQEDIAKKIKKYSKKLIKRWVEIKYGFAEEDLIEKIKDKTDYSEENIHRVFGLMVRYGEFFSSYPNLYIPVEKSLAYYHRKVQREEKLVRNYLEKKEKK